MKIKGTKIRQEILDLYKADIVAPKRIKKDDPPKNIPVKIGGEDRELGLTQWYRGGDDPKSDCTYQSKFWTKPEIKISLHYTFGKLRSVEKNILDYHSALDILH